MRLLEKRPEDRFSSAAAVREAIEASTGLSAVARRILVNPYTRFGWEIGDRPLADLDTVGHAAGLARSEGRIELHLRVFPDVLLDGWTHVRGLGWVRSPAEAYNAAPRSSC